MPGARLQDVDPVQPLDQDARFAGGAIGIWKTLPWSGGRTWRDVTAYRHDGTGASTTAWGAGRNGLRGLAAEQALLESRIWSLAGVFSACLYHG